MKTIIIKFKFNDEEWAKIKAKFKEQEVRSILWDDAWTGLWSYIEVSEEDHDED